MWQPKPKGPGICSIFPTTISYQCALPKYTSTCVLASDTRMPTFGRYQCQHRKWHSQRASKRGQWLSGLIVRLNIWGHFLALYDINKYVPQKTTTSPFSSANQLPWDKFNQAMSVRWKLLPKTTGIVVVLHSWLPWLVFGEIRGAPQLFMSSVKNPWLHCLWY